MCEWDARGRGKRKWRICVWWYKNNAVNAFWGHLARARTHTRAHHHLSGPKFVPDGIGGGRACVTALYRVFVPFSRAKAHKPSIKKKTKAVVEKFVKLRLTTAAGKERTRAAQRGNFRPNVRNVQMLTGEISNVISILYTRDFVKTFRAIFRISTRRQLQWRIQKLISTARL